MEKKIFWKIDFAFYVNNRTSEVQWKADPGLTSIWHIFSTSGELYSYSWESCPRCSFKTQGSQKEYIREESISGIYWSILLHEWDVK